MFVSHKYIWQIINSSGVTRHKPIFNTIISNVFSRRKWCCCFIMVYLYLLEKCWWQIFVVVRFTCDGSCHLPSLIWRTEFLRMERLGPKWFVDLFVYLQTGTLTIFRFQIFFRSSLLTASFCYFCFNFFIQIWSVSQNCSAYLFNTLFILGKNI